MCITVVVQFSLGLLFIPSLAVDTRASVQLPNKPLTHNQSSPYPWEYLHLFLLTSVKISVSLLDCAACFTDPSHSAARG